MQPKQLGPFRIGRVLGRGGMGSVYEAVHTETGEPAAVKVLLTAHDDSEELQQRFGAEIEVLKKLRHSNIIRLFGFGEEEEYLYFVMELVTGRTLQQELRQKRLFRWDEVCKIGLDMAQGLKHAHDRGIIHRDIKPANVMLDRQGHIKIADFGIAHVFGGSRLTNANSIIGTLEYMSPEQSLGKAIGPKSDLYALGAVLYTLLTGHTPFPARTLPELLRKHQNVPPEPIRLLRHDVPESFDAVIGELLSVLPEKRPTNAYLLVRRLQSIIRAYIGDPETIKIHPTLVIPPASLPVPSGSGDLASQIFSSASSKKTLDTSGSSDQRDNLSVSLSDTNVSSTEIIGQPDDFSIDKNDLFTQKETLEVGWEHYKFNKLNKSHSKTAPFGLLDIWAQHSPYAQSSDSSTLFFNFSSLRELSPGQHTQSLKRHFTKQIKQRAHQTRQIRNEQLQCEKRDIFPLDDQSTSSSLSQSHLSSKKRQQSFPATFSESPRKTSDSQQKRLSTSQSNRFGGEEGLGSKIQSGVRSVSSPKSGVFSPASTTSDLDEPSSPTAKTQRTSRFIQVEERELGHFSSEELISSRPLISVQTIFASTCLIVLALFAWYMLQPVPADTLYERIQTKINSVTGSDSFSSLVQLEQNIDTFITYYPNDPRRAQIDRYAEDLRLYKTQREFERRVNLMSGTQNLQLVERAYLEALTLARSQPELALEKFQAIVDLFGSDVPTMPVDNEADEGLQPPRIHRPRTASRNDLCVELARRRLEILEDQLIEMADEQGEQKVFLQKRLDKATELEDTDPKRAVAIRRAVIELYQDKSWASEIIEQIQDR